MYKIVIIESHPIIREGLFALLSKSGFEILSSYNDFINVAEDAQSLQPEVVLLDLSVFDLGEIEVIEKIKKRFVNAKILICSNNDQEDCIRSAFRAGVHGYTYIQKDSTAKQLCNAIKIVAKGQYYLSAAILPTVLNCFMNCAVDTQPIDKTNLTARELEMLRLVSGGFKNKEIANELCLSIKTIEAHRSNLMKKLNVHNIADLTIKAYQLGLKPCH